jgi:beta-lactamase superfamily II metal-dependent hydrolase
VPVYVGDTPHQVIYQLGVQPDECMLYANGRRPQLPGAKESGAWPQPASGGRQRGKLVRTELPELGAVFWPVGIGDSTTVVVQEDVILQVDLNDRDKADSDDNPEVPVVDLLVAALPELDGRPYLSAFALTHADQDHCSGFADLLEKAIIGELWATPRMWREYLEDPAGPGLCEDAKAFHEEVERRVAAIMNAVSQGQEVQPGDRLLVIGYDTDHSKHAYCELPDEYLVYPGDSITKIDGTDYAGRFEAFVHAPFKDDCAAARNDTSLAMQVTLTEDGGKDGKVLLFGDLAYDTIVKIFQYSEEKDRPEYLAWDLLLAPHHCSKKVMYISEGGRDVLRTDILEAFERHARELSVVVASSAVIPISDVANANPPHRKAADRYRDYANRFICTMEWPSVENPSPVVFGVDPSGAQIVEDDMVKLSAKTAEVAKAAGTRRRLSEVAAAATAAGRFAAGRAGVSQTATVSGPDRVRAAVASDRGSQTAPTTAVGFGRD